MTTDQPTYTWHNDVLINGQPYYTRHPAPDLGVTLVFLAERKEVTYPWHQIARVEVIDKPQN